MPYFDDLSDVGDDLGTLDISDVGLRSPFRNPFSRRKKRRKGYNARKLIPRYPGVPNPGIRLQPLGLGSSAFTAASGTVIALVARPQRPFKGQRLLIDITRTGASATGLVTITRLDVGTGNQLVSSGSLTAGGFAATAFDVNLQLDPAVPGIDITVQFAISVAPAGPDRVDFAGMILGTALG